MKNENTLSLIKITVGLNRKKMKMDSSIEEDRFEFHRDFTLSR